MFTVSSKPTKGAHSIYYVGYGASGDNKGLGISTIRVSLDDDKNDVLENILPQQPAQQILFHKTGLDVTKNHTIFVQKTSISGSHDLNIDAFIYTVPDDFSQGNGAVGGSSPTSGSNITSSSNCASMVGPVVGAAAGGITFGALVAGALTYWRMARLRSHSQEHTLAVTQSSWSVNSYKR